MDSILGLKEFLLTKRRFFALFIHLSITVMYGYGLYGYYDMACKFSNGAPEEYAGFFKYLTYWNLIFHFFYFYFSAVIDIFLWEFDRHVALKIRDYVFAGIVFPYGMFVALMFWAIFFTDRSKIFPEEAEEIYPAWLNHVSHTVLLPVVLLEAFIVKHRYPRRIKGYALTLCIGAAYLTWVLCLGIFKDIWVYIFLKDFNHFLRAVFFLVSFILAFILYFGGEKLNYVLWNVLRFPSMC